MKIELEFDKYAVVSFDGPRPLRMLISTDFWDRTHPWPPWHLCLAFQARPTGGAAAFMRRVCKRREKHLERKIDRMQHQVHAARQRLQKYRELHSLIA